MQISGEIKGVAAKGALTEAGEWKPTMSFKVELGYTDELYAEAALLVGMGVFVKFGEKMSFDGEVTAAGSKVTVEEQEGEAPIARRFVTLSIVTAYEPALFKRIGCSQGLNNGIEILPSQTAMALE